MSNLPQKLKTVNFDGLPVVFTENGYLNATKIANIMVNKCVII